MNRFEKLAAAGVRGLKPYVPGKPPEALERELGIGDSIKLASNENPLGAGPLARAAIEAGATLAAEPRNKPWGQTVAYVRAPEGTLIELCTPVGG